MRVQVIALVCMLGMAGCSGRPSLVTIVDGANVLMLQSGELRPLDLLVQAGVIIGPEDAVLLNGLPIAADEAIPVVPAITLQVRRAAAVTVHTTDREHTLHSTALTVGEALNEAGIGLAAGDRLEPASGAPLDGPLSISHQPARELILEAGGRSLVIRSAAATVGEALAEARAPLMGLDYSQPAAGEPVPADGRIRVVQVNESVVLSQKPIAFESEFLASAEVELDQQQILQPGQPGLTVTRARVRYEDGQELARHTESETTVRPPQKRIVGYGTKVVTRTTVVDGVTIEYWRAVQMYATSYSPCRSAADRCYSGTSSGMPVKQGVVAVVHRWYVYMQGQPVYIPGYGHATVEDVGGGIPGRYWIDLGYGDNDYQPWGDWVTVYFLTPVPQNIVYVLE